MTRVRRKRKTTARQGRSTIHLRARVEELEETLRAIRDGEVDALVVPGDGGESVFSLRGAEQRYRLLVEQMQQGATVVSPDGSILYCNHALAAIVGRPLESLIGSSFLNSLQVSDHQSFQLLLRNASEVISSTELELRQEISVPVPVNLALIALRDQSQLLVAIIVTDLRERKAAEQALRAERDSLQKHSVKLEEALEELEAFSYSVSHDLRTPLRAIQAYAEEVLKETALSAQSNDYLQRIRRGAGRVDRLAQDVLTYSRMAGIQIKLEPIDLNHLLAGIVEQYPQLSVPGINIPSPLHVVLGHEGLLIQALSNLLVNAFKFVAPSIVPKITVRSESVGQRVRILVEDNGIGIAPEHRNRLFKIFSRIHPESKYEGTGIGLAIAKKATEKMDGGIGFESTPGSGSTFWIDLQAATPLETVQH